VRPGPGTYGQFGQDDVAFRLLGNRAGKSSAAFSRTSQDRFGASTLGRALQLHPRFTPG